MIKKIIISLLLLATGVGIVYVSEKLHEYQVHCIEQEKLNRKEAIYSDIITLTEQGNYKDALRKVKELNDEKYTGSFGDIDYNISYKSAKELYLYLIAMEKYDEKNILDAYEFLEEISPVYGDVFSDEIEVFRAKIYPEYKEKREELDKIKAKWEDYEEEKRKEYAQYERPFLRMPSEYVDYTQLGHASDSYPCDEYGYEIEDWKLGNPPKRWKHVWDDGCWVITDFTEYGTVVVKTQWNNGKARTSSYKGDIYDTQDYSDPEDFYDDFCDDFENYEDAEDTWNEYHN